MKVLLIRPPIWYIDLSPGPFSLGLYTAFMTRYPPLGLLYAAGPLRAGGHEVLLVDAEAEELEIDSVAARVGPFSPDLIVGNVNVYSSKRNLDDLVALKERVGGVLAVRGHFPRHYPDECAGRAGVDVSFTGKGMATARAVADAFARGSDLAAIPGLRFRRGGEVVISPGAEPPEDVDALPFPPRDLLDHRLYCTNLSYRRPFTSMLASTGCPHECSYCQDHNLRYHARRVDRVLAEVEECVRRHGVREIAFLDPTFTVRRSWTVEFCDGLTALGLDLTFTMRTRPDLVDPDLLARLRRAGCVRISYGIESGDPEILANLNRRVPVEATLAAVGEAERLGIMTFGYFMLGNKGESAASLTRTMDLVRRLPLHFAQFFETIPLPGTEALEDTKRALGFDPWHEIHAGRYPGASAFLPQDIRLSHGELRKWSRRFYAEMYLNPRRWRKLLRMKYLPAYVLRQIDIARLVLALKALRRVRRLVPGFLVARYPRLPSVTPAGTER
jgi:radical SAM superfamily enzyme YgiQ (UPF0313 family)